MEMNQVRYFLALCETLNFTRAAERCNVSQPSLTRAIQQLEIELGGPLFNRERNHTHLTELGLLVRPCLTEVVLQAQTARARAASLNALDAARLKLGFSRGVATGHLTDALRSFTRAHPAVEICLLDDAPDAMREALRHGEVEIAFLPDRPHDIDDLHYRAVGTDGAGLLLRVDHPLAAASRVRLADAAAQTWIAHPGCPHLAAVDQRLAEAGLAMGARIAASHPALLPALVEAGLGIAVTGRAVPLPAGVTRRELAELAGERSVYLATKRGRLHSPCVRAFLELALKPRRGGDTVDAA